MDKAALLRRLEDAHPAWPEWDELVSLGKSLEFEHVEEEFIGSFIASGGRLTFADPAAVRWSD